MRHLLAISACMAFLMGSGFLFGDEFRYVQDGGVTYRDRIAKVAVQVPETTCQEKQVTQYCPRYTTTMQTHTKTAYLPVKDYSWQPRYHGRWNPFATPGVSYEWKPTTHWVAQTQTIQTPVNKRELVPQTQTVRTPTTTWRVVERTQIVERVAIAPGWVPGPDGKTLVAAAPAANGWQAAAPQTTSLAGTPATTSLAPLPATPSLAPVPAPTAATAGIGAPPASSVLARQPVASPSPVIVPTAPPTNWNPAAAAIARREQIGGISRFESDPPRYGTGVQGSNFR